LVAEREAEEGGGGQDDERPDQPGTQPRHERRMSSDHRADRGDPEGSNEVGARGAIDKFR